MFCMLSAHYKFLYDDDDDDVDDDDHDDDTAVSAIETGE